MTSFYSYHTLNRQALKLLNTACSKHSVSGERCKAKKAMKSRGGLGRGAGTQFYQLALEKVLFSSFFLDQSVRWNEGLIECHFYDCCGNSVDCHRERPSGTLEQNRSSSGNDVRRCG